MGAICYLDPQRQGNPNYNLKKASDIYSLGVIFWLISSGKEPFEDEVRDELLFRKIAKGLLAFRSDAQPNISQVINTLKGIEESGVIENGLYNCIHVQKFCPFTVNRAHSHLAKQELPSKFLIIIVLLIGIIIALITSKAALFM
ncbi:hypothetical protein C2G38_2030435 [Gigaspora rosea]|uniref:Protein kinase domain-containing protein n=1 Tax=Gigaspora rosea TaxID=44941 RepID=A0A397W483_9GLOM|nr:hypothetical protein C2G38_2030435 [Gigaspora rosea]